MNPLVEGSWPSASNYFSLAIQVADAPARQLFVVELFNELAIPSIAKETWQTRSGDDEWACHILKLIGNMPAEHKEAQMKRIGTTARIRPSDTFAAGMLISQETEDSLSFEAVSPCAEAVERNLLSS